MNKPTILAITLIMVMALTAASALAINIIKPAPQLQDICSATQNFSATVKTIGSGNNVSFYWNNSGTLTAICSVGNASVGTDASYSCVASTSALSGQQTIVARFYNSTPTQVEINLSEGPEFDRAGPVMSFTGANTADKAKIGDPQELDIRVSSNEQLVTPVITINGVGHAMTIGTLTGTYDFATNDLPSGTFTYTVTATDNTSCLTAGTPVSRSVNIKPSTSGQQAGIAAAVAGRNAEVTAAAQAASGIDYTKALGLLAIAAVVYMMFFHNKKSRK
jgi:hypothetical protein